MFLLEFSLPVWIICTINFVTSILPIYNCSQTGIAIPWAPIEITLFTFKFVGCNATECKRHSMGYYDTLLTVPNM